MKLRLALRTKKFRMLFYLLYLALLGGLGEAGFRYCYPRYVQYLPPGLVRDDNFTYLEHRLTPDYAAASLRDNKFYATDGLGLRRHDRAAATPAEKTVAFLGDSVIFGYRVDHNQTIPAQSEALLNGAGLAVQCRNVACPGWGTLSQRRFMAAHSAELAPDLTLLCFYNNDLENNATYLYAQDRYEKWLHSPVRKMNIFLLNRLTLYKYFIQEIYKPPWIPQEDAFAMIDPARVERETASALGALTELGGGKLVILFFSEYDRDFPAVEEVVAGYAAANDIPFYNMTRQLRAQAGDGMARYYVDGGHPNEAGCGAYGTMIAELIRSYLN